MTTVTRPLDRSDADASRGDRHRGLLCNAAVDARSRPRGLRATARLGAACTLAAVAFTTALAQSGPGIAAPAKAMAAATAPAPSAPAPSAVPASRADLPAAAPASAAPARRPRIGLVLSGGGARGLAHIGVLKVLSELRIPVDAVAATSMGAIVGGLYASGMSPPQMQEIVTSVDWTTLFSDSPPRRELSFRDKQRDTRFPLPLEIGFRDGNIRGFQGALSGGNLELFLHQLASKADGVHDFDRLPVPFRAVSTDMVSGRPYVFDSGPLYVAMRASMSIPGVFSPAEVGGRLLGDGGLVDNLPVDVVRRMGVDIVIAVNIGTPLMARERLSSVVGLTSQMINILTEQNVRQQLERLGPADVLISPDLGALTAIDFNQGAAFIAKGEAAARAAAPQLAALALSEDGYRAYLAARPKLTDMPPPVIEFVRVEGTEYANPKALEERLAIPVGEPLDTRKLDLGIARLYGTGEYERIDYRLAEDDHRQGLVVDVHEKTMGPNYLRFGLFFATDFQGESTFALLMGHRRVWVNDLGGEWLNEIELGRSFRAATEFYQPFDISRSAFVSVHGAVESAPRYVFSGSQRVAEYAVQTNGVGLDVGVPFGNSGELRVGPTYTFYKGTATVAVPGFETARQTDAGARLLARWDNLDNTFFPRHGVRANLDVFYGQRTQRLGSGTEQVSNRIARADLGVNAGFPLSANSFLNVAAHLGALNRDDPALVNPFLLGGLFNLSGLRQDQLAGSYLGFGRVVFYYRLARVPLIGGNIFAGGSAEAGNAWQQRADVSGGDLIKAGSIFVAADTFLGPIYFAYGRATGGASSFYLYLGRPP
jgi:NTE family protein